MNLSRISFLLILLTCFFITVPAVHSASIKDRMAARIPSINSLKDTGTIGENNMGFLEYRVPQKVQQELVAEENKDRTAVYAAIAKSQGATAKLVGERRAKMIVKNGKPGHWFQKPDGTWYKK